MSDEGAGARPLPWEAEVDLPGRGIGRAFLLGGFGASPEALRALGERLQAEGLDVLACALGRHTGDPEIFLRSRTWHYYLDADRRLRAFLKQGQGPLFLGGYSTGALVALLLATRSGGAPAGLVLVSPVLRTARTRTQWVGYSIGSLYYVGLPIAMVATGLAVASRWRRARDRRPGLVLRGMATTSLVAAAALGLRRATVPLRSGGPLVRGGESVLPPHFERASLVSGSTLVPLQLVARRRVASIGVPTCAVFGAADDVVDVDYGSRCLTAVPTADVHIVAGAPHRVVTHPACLDAVAGFVRRVLTRDTDGAIP